MELAQQEAVRTVPRAGHGAVVESGVDIIGVGHQISQASVIDRDLGAGHSVPIGSGLRLDCASEAAGRSTQQDAWRPTASVVCQDITSSVAAFPPNCRCKPPAAHRFDQPVPQVGTTDARVLDR